MLCRNQEDVYKLRYFLFGKERRDFFSKKGGELRQFESHSENSHFF